VKQTLRNFDELERALAEELPKATAKNVLRKSMIEAMKRIEDRARELAPAEDGQLWDSITTKVARSKRVSRTQYAQSSGVTVETGPTGRPEGGNAAWQEYGTVNMPANPFMRPASDSESQNVVDDVITVLTEQVEKAKARIARKAARR
jgi:HK97 gp10 family phage protein